MENKKQLIIDTTELRADCLNILQCLDLNSRSIFAALTQEEQIKWFEFKEIIRKYLNI